jgi:hypothetical protein
VTALVTAQMILSVILLIGALPSHRESPTALLLSATCLWVTNILVFALWYWRLEGADPMRVTRVLATPTARSSFHR